jgi:hypothetical protein
VVVFSGDGEGELARGGVGLGDRKGDAVRALFFVVFFVAILFFVVAFCDAAPFAICRKQSVSYGVTRRQAPQSSHYLPGRCWRC